MSQLADTEPPARPGPAFPLLESKLHPPPSRPTLVLRSALVERVAKASSVSVVTIVAPPGYGKTTLLTQLAEPVARRAAWLSLDDGDNDPEILLSYIAGALDRVRAADAALEEEAVALQRDVVNVLTPGERAQIAERVRARRAGARPFLRRIMQGNVVSPAP